MKIPGLSSRSFWSLVLLALVSLSSLRSTVAQEGEDSAYEYQYEYADYPYEDEYQDLPSSYYDSYEYSDSYMYEGYGDYKPSTGVPTPTPTPAGTKPSTSTPTPASTTPSGTPAAGGGGKNRKRPKIADKKNKIIEFAPEANITFGDDIDEEGKCEKEIAKLCDDVDEGEGKLADCMSDAIAESELGADGERPKPISSFPTVLPSLN